MPGHDDHEPLRALPRSLREPSSTPPPVPDDTSAPRPGEDDFESGLIGAECLPFASLLFPDQETARKQGPKSRS